MTGPSPPAPRPAQLLLGLFVVGQLGFLLAANFLPLLRPALAGRSAPAEAAAALALDGTRHWAHATGQLQGWSLYAPAVPAQSVFLAVELRWDDDPHWPAAPPARRHVLRSSVEPADPQHYLRRFGTFRLPAYEVRLSRAALDWDATDCDQRPALWGRRFADAVRADGRAMRAYLHWRWQGYRRDHPDAPPPRQALLLARIYRMSPPGARPLSWGEPVEQPLARWRPGAAGELPVEPYNPVTRRFEPVPAEAPAHD